MTAGSGSAESLVALFEAITRNLESDREDINQLDRDDGDTGDNMATNFRLVTNTLAQQVRQGSGQADIGAALAEASQVLRQEGRGATAKMYAEGLSDASQRLAGRQSFSLSELMPLLEGLLGGVQRSQGGQVGEGTLLDVLVPGILTYMEGKRAGQDDLEAILNALLNLRRGSFGTARSSSGYGRASGRSTQGEIDPGAAAAASLLEGLFGALLKSGMRQGQSGTNPAPASTGGSRSFPGPSNLPEQQESPRQAPAPAQGPDFGQIIDILGGLFGSRR